MGYELHLVKKGMWFDEANKFAESEWKALQSKESIPGWLYFLSGNISVKNPDESQIVVLVKIASRNGWSVQGDDGESYSDNGKPIEPNEEKPSFFDPVKKFIRDYKAKREIKQMMKGVVCPFKIGDNGDKVRWRTAAQAGIVIEIDYKAHYGIGSFTVKLEDGTINKTFGFDAHGFQKED